MKSCAILVILLLLGLAASGCTQAPAPAAAPASSGATPSITLSSEHPNATFSLDPGVIVVSFRAERAQGMELYLSNQSQGYGEGTRFLTSGPYAGSVAYQVPAKDTYELNISGSGPWTAAVAPLDTASPLKTPVNLSGTGTQVTPVFSLEKGEYFFERNETGLDSPIYQLFFVNGSPLMDANGTFNQPYFGTLSPHPFVFVTIPENGTYYLTALSRNNPGNWSVSISPAPKLPPMGPGPALHVNTP